MPKNGNCGGGGGGGGGLCFLKKFQISPWWLGHLLCAFLGGGDQKAFLAIVRAEIRLSSGRLKQELEIFILTLVQGRG